MEHLDVSFKKDKIASHSSLLISFGKVTAARCLGSRRVPPPSGHNRARSRESLHISCTAGTPSL